MPIPIISPSWEADKCPALSMKINTADLRGSVPLISLTIARIVELSGASDNFCHCSRVGRKPCSINLAIGTCTRNGFCWITLDTESGNSLLVYIDQIET